MLPESLKALSDVLDTLGGTLLGTETDSLPDFGGTDYRLERLLGRGGMGRVYLAEQVSLARRVAVKVVDVSTGGAQFLDEAKTVARLHHPNIVHVYAAGVCGTHPYFAMEFVEGKTAAEYVFADLAAVVRMGVTVADA